jgi:hypothetical protein
VKPVLLIGYKRTQEFANLLKSVLDSGAIRIYVALDGIESEQKFQTMKIFDKIINQSRIEYPESQILVWARERNLGSALSVISGIDWAFESENELIILEDDLIISPLLLEYFEKCLDQMKENPLVHMISGTNPFSKFKNCTSNGYANFPLVWGWATNSHGWSELRRAILEERTSIPRNFSRSTRQFLKVGKIRSQSMLIDAWDVPLSASMASVDLRCFVPKWNLVSNVGTGELATHTKENSWPLNLEIDTVDSTQFSEINIKSKTLVNYNKHIIEMIYGVRFRNNFSVVKFIFQALFSRIKPDTSKLRRELDKIILPRMM